MMNRFIYSLLLLGCAAWAWVGCTDDPNVEPLPPAGDGSPSWVTIDFGDNSFDEVNITTRATLDNTAESRVSNLFVFLFNGEGKRLYGRFFDTSNRLDSESELLKSKVDSWWVTGNATTNATEGKVRIYAPGVTGGSLYILANINADMVNISPDKLRFVQTLADLEAMTASLNQEITERNGFFPMTGSASGITVSKGDIKAPVDPTDNPDGQKNLKVMLTRLDAKVAVKLRVAKGFEESFTNAAGVTTYHKIDSFVPQSWQVVNLPRTAFVLPQLKDATNEDGTKELFSTLEKKFETRGPDEVSYEYTDKDGVHKTVTDTQTEAHGFSFYMLENRAAPKGEIPETQVENEGKGYHARDTRKKDDKGAYLPDPDGTGDIWKYAPAEGTYLVIKGEVVMAVDVNEGRDQQLSADVVYYIHLGDFGSNINDYDVERNTSYTYTITIYGVDNIQIEVEVNEGKKENESGATGHVYVAKEQILTLDSHYCRAVVSFDQAHLTDAEHLLWYVKTPFGREGSPNVIGGIEVPSGLDYQWVHFIVNEIGDDGTYSKKHAWYNPDKVKDILEFSKYIKQQKKAYDEGKENAFRPHFDKDWLDWYNKTHDTKITEEEAKKDLTGDWYRYRIYMTVFVDEFYYTADPVTGDTRQDLWKDFVNQPKRLMHILCDAEKSADEDSRTTGSVLTIRQRSIQTVFNTQKPELKTAWGCETIDETRDALWYYSRKESYVQDPDEPDDPYYMKWQGPSGMSLPTYDGNTSESNGLYNTAKIWGLLTNANKYVPKYWSEYVDFDQPYGLRDGDETETLRYACMTRNRDENGNRIIDAAEVKWYLASLSQLTSLYIGDQGIDQEAVLYPYYKEKETSKVKEDVWDAATKTFKWRAHMVSSTADDGWPQILWAEEGLSTGKYNDVYGKSASLTVRCVRNLGMDVSSEEKAQARLGNEGEIPQKAIDMKPEDGTSSVYRFDMSNMNPMSVRYYTSHELEPNSGRSVEARVYWAFETGPVAEKSYSYDELYKLLREGKSPCPEGYRVPNVREGALMSVRCPSLQAEVGGDFRVSTWYSRGNYVDAATQQDGSFSWIFNKDKTLLDNADRGGDFSYKIRCVKDIRQ